MTALLATSRHLAVAIPIVLVTGAGSLAIMSTLMLSAQVALPPWVKARGLAVVQMVFSGALTVGSLLWGALADRVGIPVTLVIAAVGLAGASIVTLRWPLAALGPDDYGPSGHWPAPVVARPIPDNRGPVMVTIERRRRTTKLESPMVKTDHNYSRLAPAISRSPLTNADAREPPSLPLCSAALRFHARLTASARRAGGVRRLSSSRSSSKGVVRSVRIRRGSTRR